MPPKEKILALKMATALLSETLEKLQFSLKRIPESRSYTISSNRVN
jgi:hypothetical protein